MMRRLLTTLIGIGIVATSVAAPVHATDKTRVKAAMVYNIMRFIKFPQARQRLQLCGLINDPISRHLRSIEGRKLGGARIGVSLYSNLNQLGSNCDVVYLDSDSPGRIRPLKRGQVLIGSARNFAENGGTVGLIEFGGQVRFVINDKAAKRANIEFSAQLLQLAANVIS